MTLHRDPGSLLAIFCSWANWETKDMFRPASDFFYKIFTEHKKGQSVGSSCIFYVKVNKVVDSYFVFRKKKN